MVSLDWLSTIGNFIVAIVAVFVAFLPQLSQWMSRPKVEVDFEPKDPYIKTVPSGHLDQKGNLVIVTSTYWVRVRVRNVGSSVLKNCKGKLVSIQQMNNGKREEAPGFSAVPLRWIGEKDYVIDIDSSEYAYLSLFYVNENASGIFNIGVSLGTPIEGIQIAQPKKDSVLQLVIYGKNITPAIRSYDVVFGKTGRYDDCTVTEIHPGKDERQSIS